MTCHVVGRRELRGKKEGRRWRYKMSQNVSLSHVENMHVFKHKHYKLFYYLFCSSRFEQCFRL